MSQIQLDQDIRSLSDFRANAASYIERVKTKRRPLVLTQHGKSAAVLMDVSEFERFTKKMNMLEDLLEAKQQVEQGKTYSMDEARDRIEKHLSKWK
jgi:prevent-host-death family protein